MEIDDEEDFYEEFEEVESIVDAKPDQPAMTNNGEVEEEH